MGRKNEGASACRWYVVLLTGRRLPVNASATLYGYGEACAQEVAVAERSLGKLAQIDWGGPCSSRPEPAVEVGAALRADSGSHGLL